MQRARIKIRAARTHKKSGPSPLSARDAVRKPAKPALQTARRRRALGPRPAAPPARCRRSQWEIWLPGGGGARGRPAAAPARAAARWRRRAAQRWPGGSRKGPGGRPPRGSGGTLASTQGLFVASFSQLGSGVPGTNFPPIFSLPIFSGCGRRAVSGRYDLWLSFLAMRCICLSRGRVRRSGGRQTGKSHIFMKKKALNQGRPHVLTRLAPEIVHQQGRQRRRRVGHILVIHDCKAVVECEAGCEKGAVQ